MDNVFWQEKKDKRKKINCGNYCKSMHVRSSRVEDTVNESVINE